MFGSFGVLFALMAFKNQHPLNAQLLFVWTLMEAYTVGVVCASYTAAGQGRIVVEALVLTAAIFASLDDVHRLLEAGLVLYGSWVVFWFAPPHFLGPVLVVLPGAGGRLVQPVRGPPLQRLIIFDTWQITERLGYDDHILASITLYLDMSSTCSSSS